MRVGIAGMGFMGVTHLGAFSKLADVQVSAVCARNPQVLSGDLSHIGGNLNRPSVPFDFSNVRAYADWTEMVQDPELDVIDICLPTNLHLPVATAALKTGKHVLCEKPMAHTATECEAMISTARTSGRTLMIAHVLRFWPEYQYLRDFVTMKPFGEILSATFVRRAGIPDWSRWLTNPALSGGAVLDLLVHDIDQIIDLFGVPEKVTAKSIGEPDTLAASFLYPARIEVRLQGGWFPAGTPFSMGFQVRSEGAYLDWTRDGLMLSDRTGQRHRPKLATHDPYEEEVRYFMECCRTGTFPELCPPAESAKAVKLALLLQESRAREGEQIAC